jgi:hypothetical protein
MPGSGDRRQLALFRKALWEEHCGICGICAEPVTFMEMWVDHVIPVSLNGGEEWANLQPSHPRCNIAKGGRNRGPVPLPNASHTPLLDRPTVDEETLQAWIGDWQPSTLPTMIRNMDPLLWQQVKQEARRHDLSAGALLNLIVNEWMTEHQCAAYGGPLEPVERGT